jgi:hypothetical protein
MHNALNLFWHQLINWTAAAIDFLATYRYQGIRDAMPVTWLVMFCK